MQQLNPGSNDSRSFEQKNVTQVINNHYPALPVEKVDIEDARPVSQTLKKIIEAVKRPAPEPSTDVINFMNELRDRIPRKIYLIPTKHLRFRKNNGRIIADVESYERELGYTLSEESDEMQGLLRTFLAGNDRESNDELKRLLAQIGQQRAAIATCDGFLINGNRRKMALEELYEESDEDPRFQTMRVILLPEGVSELEIQKVENRYQLQSEGKSEYQVLNRAIKYKRNIESGFSLDAQLRDDPNYHKLPAVAFRRVVKDFEKKFIHPLACIDRYLEALGREGMYITISESMNDREGRWQAFVHYSNFYYSTLNSPDKTARMELNDADAERLEKAVFRIIRKRSFNNRSGDSPAGKLSEFIRKLPKYLDNPEARSCILKIAEIPVDVPLAMTQDENGKKCTEREIDSKWGALHEQELLGGLFIAQRCVSQQELRDKPLELLEDALKILNHNNLMIGNMGPQYYEKGMELMQTISLKADEIYKTINHARYDYKRSGKG